MFYMNFIFLSPYQNENFINDEISHQDGDSNDYNEPFNLQDLSIFNENDELKNDIFNASFLNDYNKANNDDKITKNINDYDNNSNKKKIMKIFTTINYEKNEQIAPSSKNKANYSTTTKSNNKQKMNNNVKLGRKRRDEKYNEDIDNVHTKNKSDNIRVRYKRLFFNSLIEFLNAQLIESKNQKLKSLSFKKLNTKFIKSLKKDEILKMLNSPAFEILSQKIVKKCKRYQEYHNREIINLIYKENEEKLINILSKSIRELINTFSGNTNDDLLLKNYRLEDSIKELSKKESKDYIDKLQNEAKNFEENFMKISGRNSKKIRI